jgi:predicted dehydrogenase
MQKKVKIAIAGMGEMGMVRAVIAKGLSQYELVSVIDARRTFARLAGKQLGVSHYGSYAKAASSEEFDALMISTPFASHYELGMEAVSQGKHVFCEKPLAGDSRKAIEMHRASVRKGVVAQVGYNWRFHPTFSKAKQLVDGGVLGQLKYAALKVYKSEVTRPEDKADKKNREERFGFYGALGVHGLDLWLWFGGRPTSLSAQTTRVFSSGLSDLISAVSRFENRTHGLVDLGWSHHGFVDKDELSLFLTGTAGSMSVNADRIEMYLENEWNEFPCGDSLIYASEIPYHTEFWFTHRGLSHEMEAFAVSVLENKKPSPNWYDGYLVDRLVEALEESGRTGHVISPVIEETE